MRNDAEAHADEDKKKAGGDRGAEHFDSRGVSDRELIAENREKLSAESDINRWKKHWRRQSQHFPEVSSTDHVGDAAARTSLPPPWRKPSTRPRGERSASWRGRLLRRSSGNAGRSKVRVECPAARRSLDAEYVDVDESKKPN